MKISKIYLESGYNLFVFTPEEISLSEVKADTNLESTYVLELDINEDGTLLKTVHLPAANSLRSDLSCLRLQLSMLQALR